MIDTPDPSASELGDVDLAELAAAFGSRARHAGVPVTPEQLGRFVRAVVLTTPARVDELGRLARVTLARSHDQVELVDRLVAEVFGGLTDVADQRGDPTATPVARDERPPAARSRPQPDRQRAPDPSASGSGPSTATDDRGGDELTEDHRLGLTSRNEQLAATDFAELTDDERRQLDLLMRRIRVGVPLRRSRRHRRHPHGDRLDLRATLRRSREHGGDPLERVTRRAVARPRRLVVLCDISGSMAPYSRACIQLLHAATTATGPSSTEVFTFATRLTRLTRALAVSDPDEALARAAAAAPDWRSGTRIGASLKSFLDEHGRRGMARGAVVVIVSDGWDLDDPAVIAEQMARLARLAHRIVWINPRSAAPSFEPRAGGMAAALPFIDELASGHSLSALADAMGSLADAVDRYPLATQASPRSRATS
jgi:uncharacterized protein with von Willebrand factor type A (vWA) domain